MTIPGIRIAVPSNAVDASALLQTALASPDPVVFCEHKLLYPRRFSVPDALPPPLPFGRARVAREGTDVTIVAWSYMEQLAEQAAARLAEDEISAEVVDLRTLAPLDMDTVIRSVAKTHRALLVEEGALTGGVCGEIGFRLQEALHGRLEAPVRRIAGPDAPIPAAKSLEATVLPSVDGIVAAAMDLVV